MKTIETKKRSFKVKGYLIMLFAVLMSSLAGKAQCNANFTYTLMPNGTVHFMDISTYSGTTAIGYWNFGNGNGTTGFPSPYIHTITYPANGIYTVSLLLNDSLTPCTSSIQKTVSITNIFTPTCTPSANFNVVKDPLTPLTWNIFPTYPGGLASVTWNWGDGSSSNALYGSHTFSAAGMYNICLTVSLTCGAATTTCLYSSIYRASESSAAISVNVVSGSVGLKDYTQNALSTTAYPNPNSGEFKLSFNGLNENHVNVSVYNQVGSLVYECDGSVTNGVLDKKINMAGMPNGIYYLKVCSSNQIVNGKMILSKQ